MLGCFSMKSRSIFCKVYEIFQLLQTSRNIYIGKKMSDSTCLDLAIVKPNRYDIIKTDKLWIFWNYLALINKTEILKYVDSPVNANSIQAYNNNWIQPQWSCSMSQSMEPRNREDERSLRQDGTRQVSVGPVRATRPSSQENHGESS